MNFRENQSFWTSVILHLVVIVGLFLVTIVQAFRPKEQLHVFEMVDLSSAAVPRQSAPPVDVPPAYEMPDIKPLEIPEYVPPVPTPAPVAVPTARPTPTPKPVEQAEPKPVKPAAPKLMSLADFRKDNPEKKPKVRQPKPKPDFKAPTIDTSRINQSLRNLTQVQVSAADSRAMSAAERSAMQRYSSLLNRRLNAAWKKPGTLSGAALVATVVFDVSSSGRIQNARLSPRSGNSAFDRSVLAAFKAVSSAGPTPMGQAQSFTMSFSMVD